MLATGRRSELKDAECVLVFAGVFNMCDTRCRTVFILACVYEIESVLLFT